MAYQVRDKTKKQTRKCSYNFACLRNDTWDTCSIESDLPGGFLVVKSKENASACNYSFPCDDSYYCNCPARSEIFRRYKK